MKHIVKQPILKIKPYVPGKPIDEVKRELGLTDVIKLASNENPYPPSPRVLSAIAKAARTVNRYPDGGCFIVRQLLAKKHNIQPEQLIFGNGSDELIVLAVRAFAGPGDEVIMAKPSFLIYEIASQVCGASVKAVPLKDFRYDLGAMKKAVTDKTRIIFLGNPDNPSGMYIKQDEMDEFLEGLRSDILIFIDEAYYEFVGEPDYVDSLNLVAERENVMVTRTFSKMYGLAGLRIGYGIAQVGLMDLINRVREPFNVNSLAQAAAAAALKDRAYYQDVAKKVRRERDSLYRNLEKMGVAYIPSFTNFICIDVGQKASTIAQGLLAKGVIVRDMTAWGLERYIRVSIGTHRENRRFIQSLKELI